MGARKGGRRRLQAFVPAHLSGFFEICPSRHPKRMGSRNGGPCLQVGVLTRLEVREGGRGVRILINGKRSEAKTSLYVARSLLSQTSEELSLRVEHEVQVPVGAGYGASGAGALGLALTLSRALGLRAWRREAVQEAHVAEVRNLTGLGDVGAQARGGMVIGERPGSPPYGSWRRIPIPREMRVVSCTLGELSTKKALSDPELRKRSRKLGRRAVEELLAHPSLRTFLRVSSEFAEGLGLLDEELREVRNLFLREGAVGATQTMLGRGIFGFVREDRLERLVKELSGSVGERAVVWSAIDPRGARLL
jgi:pantoate kinase